MLTGRSGLPGEGEEIQTSDLGADVIIFLASEDLKAALAIHFSSGIPEWVEGKGDQRRLCQGEKGVWSFLQ